MHVEGGGAGGRGTPHRQCFAGAAQSQHTHQMAGTQTQTPGTATNTTLITSGIATRCKPLRVSTQSGETEQKREIAVETDTTELAATITSTPLETSQELCGVVVTGGEYSVTSSQHS